MSTLIGPLILKHSADHLGPQDIAEAVLYELDDPVERLRALREVLPAYVSMTLGTQRNAAIKARNGSSDQAPKFKSRQVESQRAAYAKMLSEQIATSTGYMRLADLTADLLREVAQVRFDRAEAHRVRGEQYRRLAEAVDSAGVGKVSDLPEHVVLAAFDG